VYVFYVCAYRCMYVFVCVCACVCPHAYLAKAVLLILVLCRHFSEVCQPRWQAHRQEPMVPSVPG